MLFCKFGQILDSLTRGRPRTAFFSGRRQ